MPAEAEALAADPEDRDEARGVLADVGHCVRGDVYALRAPRDVHDDDQRGNRYAVVERSDLLPLSTWLVSPTSTTAREASFRREVEIGGKMTRVLVEQTTAIDPERPGLHTGHLGPREMADVDAALPVVLGLDAR